MSDSPQFSIFYLGGPHDGRCFMRSFPGDFRVGQTLSQILSVERSSHTKWLQPGESGPTVVRAEHKTTHVNGFVAVAKFLGNATGRLS